MYTEGERERQEEYHFLGISSRQFRGRYPSFLRYFHWLKQLGWVEETKKTEESLLGGNPKAVVVKTSDFFPGRDSTMVEIPQPRRFYRLSPKGETVDEDLWSYPQIVLYPDLPAAAAKYAHTREDKRKRRKALRVD